MFYLMIVSGTDSVTVTPDSLHAQENNTFQMLCTSNVHVHVKACSIQTPYGESYTMYDTAR